MGADSAVTHERGDSALGDRVALAIDGHDLVRGTFDQVGSAGDVAEPQTGRDQLGERADIGHAAVAVAANHRQQGPAFKVELVVVVVLEDDEAELGGQREEAHAPFGTHRHRGRILVVGRDVDDADATFAAERLELLEVDAVFVESDGGGLGADGARHVADRSITQSFEGDRVAAAGEDAEDEGNGHVAAPGEADVFGAAEDAALQGEHRGDFSAQAPVAARVSVTEVVGGGAECQRPGSGTRQQGMRQQPVVGQAVIDGDCSGYRHDEVDCRRAAKRGGGCSCDAGGRGRCLERARDGESESDEGAALRLRNDPAL